MTTENDVAQLDAYEQPSDEMRATWKKYSKADHKDMKTHPDIDDPRAESQRHRFHTSGQIPADRLLEAFSNVHKGDIDSALIRDVPILYHPMLSGLLIIPDLVPPPVQESLLDLMIHRDLSVPHHQTNLHLHHTLPYTKRSPEDSQNQSFFAFPPTDQTPLFVPKDPSVHKPYTMKQVLDRRLHWVTLGGQYDWTNRVYPESEPPPVFPPDIGAFLETLFPDTLAQAAIVNFYTPGDTMMMHRDVSEEVDRGLVSLSFGCDGLFMIAPNDAAKGREVQNDKSNGGSADGEKPYLLLKLRSGDAIYMTKESRFAWHGVPKVLKGTCPEWLGSWPAEDAERGDDVENGGHGEENGYQAWSGWMRNKRINLNVRQMKD